MSAAAPIIKQSAKQTTPMKRVLLPEVLGRDSEMVRVHVPPTGFIINPKAPRSAARPDGGSPIQESPHWDLVKLRISFSNYVPQGISYIEKWFKKKKYYETYT